MSEKVNGRNASGSDGSGVDWQSFDSEGFLRRLVDEFGLSVAEIEYAGLRLAGNEMARLEGRIRLAMEGASEEARLAGQFDEDKLCRCPVVRTEAVGGTAVAFLLLQGKVSPGWSRAVLRN